MIATMHHIAVYSSIDTRRTAFLDTLLMKLAIILFVQLNFSARLLEFKT